MIRSFLRLRASQSFICGRTVRYDPELIASERGLRLAERLNLSRMPLAGLNRWNKLSWECPRDYRRGEALRTLLLVS
jgi:hypothetical protein